MSARMTRRADHPSTCPRCDRPIHVGDPIARVRGGYVHVGCGRGE